MKCSCELRFWVRKAISHLSSQQLSRKSGSCLPLWCPRPWALAAGARVWEAGINIAAVRGRWPGAGGSGPAGPARWERGAAGRGALGDPKAVFPLVLIGLCDSNGAHFTSWLRAGRGLPRRTRLEALGRRPAAVAASPMLLVVLGLEGPGKQSSGCHGVGEPWLPEQAPSCHLHRSVTRAAAFPKAG